MQHKGEVNTNQAREGGGGNLLGIETKPQHAGYTQTTPAEKGWLSQFKIFLSNLSLATALPSLFN